MPKTKSQKKSQKSDQLSLTLSEAEFEIPPTPPPNPVENRIINITINYVRNILPLYSVSDIKLVVKYLDNELGETELIPVVDDEQLSLNANFQLTIDVDSLKQVDLLASNPIYITAIQSSGNLDPSLYEQLQEIQHEVGSVEDVESLFSFYEAINGEKPAVKLKEVKQKAGGKQGKTAKTKSAGTSKASVKSKSSKGSKTSSSVKLDAHSSIKSEIYGMCVLDVIPLFYGNSQFSETLLLQPIKTSCDILSTIKNFPEVSITVSIEDEKKLVSLKNILSVTVESICQIPNLMLTDMEYKVCLMLPLQNNGSVPTIFYNPKIVSYQPKEDSAKRWPGVWDIGYNANTTKYLINHSFDDVINKSNLKIQEAYSEDSIRIEFNTLRRNVIYQNGNNDFAAHILQYRKLVAEIFVSPKSKKTKSIDQAGDDKGDAKHKQQKLTSYLHLMAVFDVIGLHYPGQTKVRIAAPLRTFTYEEASQHGLEDSYFIPRAKTDTSSTKASRGKDSKSKRDKPVKTPTKDKSSAKGGTNLADQLPPKPEELPPPEPSVQIYNDDGNPCFMIIEIELLNPITPKRDIEELQQELYDIQMDALQTSKSILAKNVTDDLYLQTIREIVEDLNKHWVKYNETTIPQKQYKDFIEYLRQVGAYQSYLASIKMNATLLVTNKYHCDVDDFKNDKKFQNLISEIFKELISQMHSVLNSLVCSDMKPIQEKVPSTWERLHFYAKEATELQQFDLAQRYCLERICNDIKPIPESWLDYAIYNIEIEQFDKAFECVREAMAINPQHKYALLMYSLFLANKSQIKEAETSFLNLLILNATWAEGWCILYLFYQKIDRYDGTDMALDKANDLKDRIGESHYLVDFEDLAWSTQNLPNTLFLRTAAMLLKLRFYSWVELALAEEVLIPKHYGYVNYLLAVIGYYKRDYNHAMEHIEEAKEHLGADIPILSLSGHILFRKYNLPKAKEEYFRVIESYNRSDDIHLVYLNCASILNKLGDNQKARKLMLLACKLYQTPYRWLNLGQLYFYQNDLLSAEECLNEANMKDNVHGDVWGYLTLVNLKLSRVHEAEQCYQQAVKSKIDDKELCVTIMEYFNKLKR